LFLINVIDTTDDPFVAFEARVDDAVVVEPLDVVEEVEAEVDEVELAVVLVTGATVVVLEEL